MSVFVVRNVLPVVTSVVATLFLATAVPHGMVPETAAIDFSLDGVASAEVRHCMAGGRSTEACLDEADGKALVERADWLAREDGTGPQASGR